MIIVVNIYYICVMQCLNCNWTVLLGIAWCLHFLSLWGSKNSCAIDGQTDMSGKNAVGLHPWTGYQCECVCVRFPQKMFTKQCLDCFSFWVSFSPHHSVQLCLIVLHVALSSTWKLSEHSHAQQQIAEMEISFLSKAVFYTKSFRIKLT